MRRFLFLCFCSIFNIRQGFGKPGKKKKPEDGQKEHRRRARLNRWQRKEKSQKAEKEERFEKKQQKLHAMREKSRQDRTKRRERDRKARRKAKMAKAAETAITDKGTQAAEKEIEAPKLLVKWWSPEDDEETKVQQQAAEEKVANEKTGPSARKKKRKKKKRIPEKEEAEEDSCLYKKKTKKGTTKAAVDSEESLEEAGSDANGATDDKPANLGNMEYYELVNNDLKEPVRVWWRFFVSGSGQAGGGREIDPGESSGNVAIPMGFGKHNLCVELSSSPFEEKCKIIKEKTDWQAGQVKQYDVSYIIRYPGSVKGTTTSESVIELLELYSIPGVFAAPCSVAAASFVFALICMEKFQIYQAYIRKQQQPLMFQ